MLTSVLVIRTHNIIVETDARFLYFSRLFDYLFIVLVTSLDSVDLYHNLVLYNVMYEHIIHFIVVSFRYNIVPRISVISGNHCRSNNRLQSGGH